MIETEFMRYFALFNARRYDEFAEYYADDVVYIMDANAGKIFNGPAEIVELYKMLHEYFDEHVGIENIAISDTMVAVEVPTTIRARKPFDLPGFIPVPKGQTLTMMCFNHYDLDAFGKFKRIRAS